MSTGHTAAEELENLLRHNTDDPAWCGRFLDRAVEVGTISPEAGQGIWNSVFGATPQTGVAQGGGAVAWVVIVLLALAGCAALWLISEWLAAGTWLR
jgi:hypothetical protein